MLEEDVKKYIELKEQIEKLSAEKDILSNSIKEALDKIASHSYTTADNRTVKIVSRTTYTYLDEAAIMQYVILKGLGDVYVMKKIDTKRLNKELKSKGKLFEGIKPYVSENISYSLNVED